jgi:flagellin-specific chaperone FliS
VNWCQRADAIVLELRLSLVPVDGSDLTTNLENLYVFCEGRIGQALSTDTHEPLHEARKVLVTLLDAWRRIETPPEPDAGA